MNKHTITLPILDMNSPHCAMHMEKAITQIKTYPGSRISPHFSDMPMPSSQQPCSQKEHGADSRCEKIVGCGVAQVAGVVGVDPAFAPMFVMPAAGEVTSPEVPPVITAATHSRIPAPAAAAKGMAKGMINEAAPRPEPMK